MTGVEVLSCVGSLGDRRKGGDGAPASTDGRVPAALGGRHTAAARARHATLRRTAAAAPAAAAAAGAAAADSALVFGDDRLVARADATYRGGRAGATTVDADGGVPAATIGGRRATIAVGPPGHAEEPTAAGLGCGGAHIGGLLFGGRCHDSRRHAGAIVPRSRAASAVRRRGLRPPRRHDLTRARHARQPTRRPACVLWQPRRRCAVAWARRGPDARRGRSRHNSSGSRCRPECHHRAVGRRSRAKGGGPIGVELQCGNRC